MSECIEKETNEVYNKALVADKLKMQELVVATLKHIESYDKWTTTEKSKLIDIYKETFERLTKE